MHESVPGPPDASIGADFIHSVTRSWGRGPAGTLLATHRTQVAAALWRDDKGATEELTADVSVAVHALCVACDPSDVDTSVDGRLLHSGMVAEGSFNIVRPGERSRGVNRGRWERLHIYLPNTLLQDLADEDGLAGPGQAVELVNPVWGHDTGVLRIARQIVQEICTGPAMSRLRLDALSQDIAITLLRAHSNLKLCGADPVRRGGLAPWQIKRATAAMDAKLDGDVGLGELAALCGVSTTHFGRAFKRSTGTTPMAWLLDRRIARAKDLLLQNQLSLYQIALAVGFAGQPQFTTAFRRATGATPGAWQRERHS